MLGADGSLIELNRALSDKIAKGEVDLQTPGLAEHLWQTTMDKLAVDQPNYASYKRELGNRVVSVILPRHCGSESAKQSDAIRVSAVPWIASLALAMTRDDERREPYFPSHFGGRFSENAFGPSM